MKKDIVLNIKPVKILPDFVNLNAFLIKRLIEPWQRNEYF